MSGIYLVFLVSLLYFLRRTYVDFVLEIFLDGFVSLFLTQLRLKRHSQTVATTVIYEDSEMGGPKGLCAAWRDVRATHDWGPGNPDPWMDQQ
jgi:hypothetical protein